MKLLVQASDTTTDAMFIGQSLAFNTEMVRTCSYIQLFLKVVKRCKLLKINVTAVVIIPDKEFPQGFHEREWLPTPLKKLHSLQLVTASLFDVQNNKNSINELPPVGSLNSLCSIYL